MNFPVRMKHPNHGFMHAYDKEELERLKGWGWSPEEPEAGSDALDRYAAVAQAEAIALAPKKRGRPKKAQA